MITAMGEQNLYGVVRLRPEPSHDTFVYEDQRCGLSLLIPAPPDGAGPSTMPRLMLAPPQEQPALESQVRLSIPALDVQLRVQRSPEVVAQPEVALAFAHSIARSRGAGDLAARAAEPGRFPGADAAAGADLTLPGGPPCDLLVLLRPGVLVLVLKRGDASTTARQFALTNSAINGSIRFVDPLPRRTDLDLWPRSDLQGPGLPGAINAAWRDRAAAALQAQPTPLAALRERLDVIVRGSESPFTAIDAATRATYQNYLGDVCSAPALRAVIADGLAAVRTAHDLRGLALAIDEALAPG